MTQFHQFNTQRVGVKVVKLYHCVASIAIAYGLGPCETEVSSSTDQLQISREDFYKVIQGNWKEALRRVKQKKKLKVHFCNVVETFELVYNCSLGIKTLGKNASLKGVTGSIQDYAVMPVM